MEESNKITKIFEELYEMYIKTKVEMKCVHDIKVDTNEQNLCFDPMIKFIDEKMETIKKDTETYIRLLCMKISLLFEQIKVLIILPDQDPNKCLELLNNALQDVEEYKYNPQMTYLYFKVINILGYYHAKSQNLDEARKLLETAEILYRTLNVKSEMLVYNTDELFQNIVLTKSNPLKFEKLINNNLQIQAWVYNKLSMNKKFIIYHHMVLNRQLETHDGSAIAWFYKCARLAVYFFSNCKFKEARHHLSAAYSILREYELELLKFRSEAYFASEWNNLKRYYADMGKYWVKYGIFLFNSSRHLAVSQTPSELNMNDLFINSFQDSPTSNAGREWYTMSKNSKLFTPEHTVLNELLSEKQCHENDNIVKENEPNTDIPKDTNDQMFPESKIEDNVILETDKEEKKTNNTGSNLNEATKIILETLNYQHKDVEAKAEINNKQENADEQKIKDSVATTKIEAENKPNELSNEDEKEKNEQFQNISLKERTSIEQPKSSSKTNLKESKQNESTNENSTEKNDQQNIPNKSADKEYDFKFPSLHLAQYEKQITAELVKTTDQARLLFLYVQEWAKRAKAFYTIHEYPHEHIQLILDLNDLYYYLSLFETDIESQYDVLRRRVEILESLSSMLKELRPQEYLFLSVELLQELTQSQIDLLMLNIRRLTHVQSAGELLLKDICQGHNDATRKVEALLEIQRRLGRRDTDARLSLIDMQLFR